MILKTEKGVNFVDLSKKRCSANLDGANLIGYETSCWLPACNIPDIAAYVLNDVCMLAILHHGNFLLNQFKIIS